MTSSLAELGSVAVKCAATALSGPSFLARATFAATLAVAEELLGQVVSGAVPDIRRIKEAVVGGLEAETLAQMADAQKRLTEAAEAANRANLRKRNDAIAKAEAEQARQLAAKTAAEADAARMDAETRRIQAVAEAQARLLEAVGKLRQEGGNMLLSEENLRAILGLNTLPPGKQPPQAA